MTDKYCYFEDGILSQYVGNSAGKTISEKRKGLDLLPNPLKSFGVPREQNRKVNKVICLNFHLGLPKDFRPLHGLSHYYATMLASTGKVDMYTLQKLLTHKSPQMTQRYAHLRDEALKGASDSARELIEQAVKEEKDKVSDSESRG